MTPPLVLGIETSCDETGAGLVRGRELLANTIASSADEHARFGGVVPEGARRRQARLRAESPRCACRGRPARARTAARARGRAAGIRRALLAAADRGPGPAGHPARRDHR